MKINVHVHLHADADTTASLARIEAAIGSLAASFQQFMDESGAELAAKLREAAGKLDQTQKDLSAASSNPPTT